MLLALCTALVMSAVAPAQEGELTPVTIQLRWDHQFQFAGYYAADWQGYYEDAGFDVDIRSAITDDGEILRAVDEVAAGTADFGVGSADILLARDDGVPLVVLASIFQHSAAAFYSLEGRGIRRPSDLAGAKVARNVDDLIDVELQAMLFAEGIDLGDVPAYPHQPGFDHLVDGDVDVMPGYTLSLDYQFEEAGIAIETLRAVDYGVDFYGDSLFTHERLANEDPEALDRFVDATRRGWAYALENPNEIADRISLELPRTAAVAGGDLRGFNRFQTGAINELTAYPLVEVGNTSPERWGRMHELLMEAGSVSEALDPSDFVFDFDAVAARKQKERTNLLAGLLFGGFGLGIIAVTWIVALRRRVDAHSKSGEETLQLAQALTRINQVIHSTLEFDEISQRALIEGARALGADSAVLSSHDAEGWLNLNSHGFDPPVAGMRLKDAQVTNGALALKTREPVAVDDCFTDGRVDNDFMREWRLRSAIAAPLIIQGEPAGAVFFNHLDDVHHFTDAEIDFVSSLTSSLALALANARLFTEVEDLNSDLERRVAERTEELQVSNNGLLVATQAKSDFLASMSHELRTPLNSIIGFSGLLSDGQVGPLDAEQKRQVDMINSSGMHLLHLINEVLDLAKIEAGGLHVEFAPFSVKDAVDEAVASAMVSAKAKGLSLTCDVDPSVGEIRSSRIQVTQILLNLLSNAIKYTDAGSVDVSVVPDGAYVAFRVSDTGRGIDADDLLHIFEEFYQARRDDVAKSEGTGLGLAVSHRLVEALGGSIDVTSVVGEGSTFTVLLPIDG